MNDCEVSRRLVRLANRLSAAKGEVPEAFKEQWKKKDKDGDGKENEEKPDFVKEIEKSKKAAVAERLVRLAESLVAMDFDTPEAMKKYLHDHPDADKSRHHVKKQAPAKNDDNKSKTHDELKMGLGQWVKNFNEMKSFGNNSGARGIKRDIERVIKDKGLDADTVWNHGKKAAVAERLVRLAKSLVSGSNDTFECPECGTKVLEQTGFCVKCKKKVKKSSKGEVPEAFKEQWKKKDKDGDGKENEEKPDFVKEIEKSKKARDLMAARGDHLYPDGNKWYNTMFGVGKAKYVVNHHDGVSTHKDGSSFYDIALFSNKIAFAKFVRGLKQEGYREE